MSEQREHWYAYEVESFLVVLLCAGMMAFGMLFFVVGKVATHRAFQECLQSGCDHKTEYELMQLRLDKIAAELDLIEAYLKP